MKKNTDVVVVDDDRDFSRSLVQMLELENHVVSAYSDPVAAIKGITRDFAGVVLLDVRMPNRSGEDILKHLKALDSTLPVILMTGHGDIPMAVRALKEGAYGFFTKPLQLEEFHSDIRRAQDARRIEMERRKLARQIEMRDDLVHIVVGASPAMVALRQLILKIGSADVDVLIQGETGTGKELVARALTQVSSRSDAPFVAQNCGALDTEHAASELFGQVMIDGSGVKTIQTGRFDRANGGTLLLDEIENTPLDIQLNLLRVLQERSFERVNSIDEVALNVRIVATTKVDLTTYVAQGKFREDLFYRLNGVTISLPPLRDRGADAVILFERFLRDKPLEQNAVEISADLMAELLSHDWPGNVRELVHAADRFAAGLSVFGNDKLSTRSNSLSARVANFEKGLIEAALTYNKGSIKRAMLDLDVPRKTLQDKMNKYQINRTDYLSN